MNILFLDDNPERCKAFQSRVPSAVITTTAAETIAELEKNPNKVWDLLCLDHDLGGETYVDSDREDCGAEVARWLSKNSLPDTNIILHTYNAAGSTNMLYALESTTHSIINAPFGSATFWHCVKQAVELIQQRDG